MLLTILESTYSYYIHLTGEKTETLKIFLAHKISKQQSLNLSQPVLNQSLSLSRQSLPLKKLVIYWAKDK